MQIWICGSPPQSGSRNAWTRIKNVYAASKLSNFLNFLWCDPNDFLLGRLVTMDETCLYHYDPKAKEHSVNWQRSGSSRPQIFRVQKSTEKVLASIFWGDQDGILLIDYLSMAQTIIPEYYLSLLVELKDTLKENLPREFHQSGLVLARKCPSPPNTCNPEETGLPVLPLSWSSTLFSGSCPVAIQPVYWTEKQLKIRHFSSDTEVIAAEETWLDGQHSEFFWVACKR